MTLSVVEVEMQWYKCGCIWLGKSDVLPFGILEITASMAPTQSLVEERPPQKKRPAHNIGCRGTTIESMVLKPDYRAQDCSGGSRQWKQLVANMEIVKRW